MEQNHSINHIEAYLYQYLLGPGDCFINALIFMEVVPETVSLLFYNIKSAIFTSNIECLT